MYERQSNKDSTMAVNDATRLSGRLLELVAIPFSVSENLPKPNHVYTLSLELRRLSVRAAKQPIDQQYVYPFDALLMRR